MLVRKIILITAVICILFFQTWNFVSAEGKPVSIEMGAGQSEITLLEGGVFLVKKDLK